MDWYFPEAKVHEWGTDKGLIDYHGMPQREYLYQLLAQVCEHTYLSIREEQRTEIPSQLNTLVDLDEFKGPFNGILSAHRKHPDVAWLVLACDLPLIDGKALNDLITSRNSNYMATAFAQKERPLPEPLCAIWEPESLAAAIPYLQGGAGSCPRKYLINNDTHLVFPTNKNVLLNANSEEEYKEAMMKLS